MKRLTFILTLILNFSVAFGQFNMLGSDYNHIFGKMNEDAEFYNIKIDTINISTIVMTCKSSEPYPYYTYEIDRRNNECVSFGTVSKDRQVFDTYVDLLNTVGTLVECDQKAHNFTYEVTTSSHEKLYYTIRQPYISSEYISRRSIFYVLVTKDKK